MKRLLSLALLCGSLSSAPAFAADVLGTWSGGGLTITLKPDGRAGYAGTVILSGQTWPLSAQDNGATAAGVAEIQGQRVAFLVAPMGNGVLQLQTADGLYLLSRVGPAPSAAPSPSTPAADILAKTPFASLSRDAVLAYHEALLFCMDYAGMTAAKSQVTQDVVLAALPRYFPTLSPEDQVGLANARATWTRTRANWKTMSESERRAFASVVLELAFGKAPASGSSAGRTTGGLPGVSVPYEGSDCWASAGCEYDEGSGNRTYEEPSMDLGGGGFE